MGRWYGGPRDSGGLGRQAACLMGGLCLLLEIGRGCQDGGNRHLDVSLPLSPIFLGASIGFSARSQRTGWPGGCGPRGQPPTAQRGSGMGVGALDDKHASDLHLSAATFSQSGAEWGWGSGSVFSTLICKITSHHGK